MKIEPKIFLGVMVSSTFTDLAEHRVALIAAINNQDFKDLTMERDAARVADVIESSLEKVRDATAYIGIISHRYGQTPKCADNLDELSITELEFNEALRLERPILLFIMGDTHPVQKADVEIDPAKIKKLEAFRERAKQMGPGSPVHRVYAEFSSLEEFKNKAIQSVAELRRYLDAHSPQHIQQAPPIPIAAEADPIPQPPAFYAEPRYIGSHTFVGRQAELDRLSDWAAAADTHPVLLFDAIGGSGKSMLTWEWTNNHATKIRSDWAGRFWYSFYERGAIMADFCRCALAYITGQPFDSFKKMKTPEMAEKLLHHLENRPWLFILDGLERVLVAYHRIDAAEVADEEANRPTDQIAQRDPCSSIRPEDDDLLRALAAAAPSKILITSRLVPRVLLNQAMQPILGVLRVPLHGLRPPDAEALFRSCGITGDSAAMQNYLKTNCDCHPLVTGALAGIVNDYLPDKGNFDAWLADAAGGGRLNLAELDLTHRRNHILKAAIQQLEPKSRELLSTLALLSEAVDYPTLSALNPHLPPEPEDVEMPEKPEERLRWRWERMSKKEKQERQQKYQEAMRRRKEYEEAVEARLKSAEFLAAPQELTNTVRDLERRGLLQFDGLSKHYDLHPVVRAVSVGGLEQKEKEGYGQRVVDYFSAQKPRSYDETETIEDVRNGLHVVRTLLKMGRYQEAVSAYMGDLSEALLYNLEANAEALALLRHFFRQGWSTLPDAVAESDAVFLANDTGFVLNEIGQPLESMKALGLSLNACLKQESWSRAATTLRNLSVVMRGLNHFTQENFCLAKCLDLANVTDDEELLFMTRLFRFDLCSVMGCWEEAQTLWELLDPMGREWNRAVYRPGDAENYYARSHFWRGDSSEEHLNRAEQLARAGKNRVVVRWLYGLRGEWHLERGEWALAAASLGEAVSMARAVRRHDALAETQLVLAKFNLGQLEDPRREAEHLVDLKYIANRPLAELWLALGDREQAKKHALSAYKAAWADGEPYVYRYELNKARCLLEKLGVEVPKLPDYDPAKREKFFWEDELVAAIEKLRAKREAG